MNLYDTGFKREMGHEYIQGMIDEFLSFFKLCSFVEHPPVKIHSRIDKTVIFIGSHISVLKPYLLNDELPEKGYVITQPCVRTQNLGKYKDEHFYPNWGSTFRSLGLLTPLDNAFPTMRLLIRFMREIWGIGGDNMKIRISKVDSDLMHLAHFLFDDGAFEIDTKPSAYYRHKIGVDGVWGRNFNIAIKNAGNGNFEDIGNVIMLENSEKVLGVEFAFGTSTILKSTKGLSHVLECNPILGTDGLSASLKIRFEDSLVTSMILYNDGLEPSNADITNRLMKKYIGIMLDSANKSRLDMAKIEKICIDYEALEFDGNNANSKKLLNYILLSSSNKEK
jgi:hypothetical protein